MAETPLLTRQVDLRQVVTFAQNLLAAVRGAAGKVDMLAILRAGVHAECPQCHLRLFGEDVLALAGSEAPQAEVSPKLHRLAQGFCGRQGCEALFYEFTFEPAPPVDWSVVLAQVDSAVAPETGEVATAAAEVANSKAAAKKRTRLRVLAGLAVVVLLLLARHLMTGGTIPFLREPRHFTADPKSVPHLGETGAPPPAPATNQARTFRAAP